MMTCKDCFHFDACDFYENFECKNDNCFACSCLSICGESTCQNFQDKRKLIELPCNVGDTVYIPWIWDGVCGLASQKIIVATVYIDGEIDFSTDMQSDDDEYLVKYARFHKSDIGRTVFLTREEAEKALEEKKHD